MKSPEEVAREWFANPPSAANWVEPLANLIRQARQEGREQAAKVLYWCDPWVVGNENDEPVTLGWEELHESVHADLANKALMLLKWEHIRPPSEAMVDAGHKVEEYKTLSGQYIAMSAARIRELEGK